jgi:hypothetical protein
MTADLDGIDGSVPAAEDFHGHELGGRCRDDTVAMPYRDGTDALPSYSATTGPAP